MVDRAPAAVRWRSAHNCPVLLMGADDLAGDGHSPGWRGAPSRSDASTASALDCERFGDRMPRARRMARSALAVAIRVALVAAGTGAARCGSANVRQAAATGGKLGVGSGESLPPRRSPALERARYTARLVRPPCA